MSHLEKILAAKPYIIAEVGSNWHDRTDIRLSFEQAKWAGADAVKFQLFSNYDLYGPGSEGDPTALVREVLPAMKAQAEHVGIDFMCSAFSIEGYLLIDPFVKYHKIASSEFNHVPLVREVVKMGKPIIASTGGVESEDEFDAMALEYDEKNTLFLRCSGAYPSWDAACASDSWRDYRLNGLSDHTLGILLPVAFWRSIGQRGFGGYCCVIEKHFRLDHITDTADAPHSLTPAEFQQMVDLIRAPVPDDEEAEFKRTALRRAKALTPINCGERLQYGVNYAYFRDREGRPGLSPTDHDKNEGRVVVRSMMAGECIEAARDLL